MPDETLPQELPSPDATSAFETQPQSKESAQVSAEKSQPVPGYQLLDEVGRGGMGVVHRARDLSFNRDVAVKLLKSEFPADGPTARRFLEEAQITAQLQHPGIPAVHQVGTLANGRPYLAMKLIKGRSLQEMLDAKESINVLAVFEQIAQAIGYAHAHGVIHRDLKPANVMVGAFGEVQVMDWGLAKLVSRDSKALRRVASDSEPEETKIHLDRASDHATQAGHAMGTAAFMPPEQAIGAHDQMGPPSDVFGLGAVLCTLLTGKSPYQGVSWESTRQLAAQAKQNDALARLDACGAEPELIALCKHCLAAEAKDRPADGSAVAEAVATLRAAADERAKQAEVRAAEQRTRRRVQLVFGSAVVATLLIGSAVAGWQAWEAKIAKRQADAKTVEAENEVRTAIAANAELLAVADERQFKLSFPKIAEKSKLAIPPLLAIIETPIADDAKDDDKERLAKHQANAAVALLRMNETESVWPLLKHSPDPRRRSYLIHRLAPLGADPEMIIARLDAEQEISIRRAVVLSLGEFNLAETRRNELIPKLQVLYRKEPDAGLHSAVEWLLRTWKQDEWLRKTNDEWAKSTPHAPREEDLTRSVRSTLSPTWRVNSQGQTMIRIPGPVEFTMGSPPTEAGHYPVEKQARVKIPRSFEIAAKTVTYALFARFRRGHKDKLNIYPSSPHHPAAWVSWHDAAAYCNWLSEQEKIPEEQWCYVFERVSNRLVVAMRPNYLSLKGYRLPTEAEWEYAARADTRTARAFGETDELLPNYVWFDNKHSNGAQPVGVLKPNDYGQFDSLGNVSNWCQGITDWKTNEEKMVIDMEDEKLNITPESRMMRGGNFNRKSSYARSAYREHQGPWYAWADGGFRIAKTYTP